MMVKKSKLDQDKIEKMGLRNSKLEKFYQKERSKKYRNCGS